MSEIHFYDTRTRALQPFVPIEAGKVGIYTCGPTVYGPQHVGNLRSRLFSDLLKRFLRSEGFDVTHVINITDVGHLVSDADEGEDKMEVAAKKAGRTALEIAAHYTEMWREDGRAVNCLDPEHNPKATDHIAEQIDLGQRLEAEGYLYTIEDGVYLFLARNARLATQESPQAHQRFHRDVEGAAALARHSLCEAEHARDLGVNRYRR